MIFVCTIRTTIPAIVCSHLKMTPHLFFKSGKNNELEFQVETGKIVFFPSALDHYVPENQSTETRISFSFNLYLSVREYICQVGTYRYYFDKGLY